MNDKIGIDEVDAKILKMLIKDPRTKFERIAKYCNRSTNTIRTRFNRLKRVGIITGSILQINPKSFGYDCNGIIQVQTDFEEGEDFLEVLAKIPGLITSFRQMGQYNIMSFFALTSLYELDELVQSIIIHPHVLKTKISISVDITIVDHPENLEIEPQKHPRSTNKRTNNNNENRSITAHKSQSTELTNQIEMSSIVKFDDINVSIIRFLVKNARISFRKLAMHTGISTQSVITRYNKIRKIMPFSSITINLEKIGYIGVVIFLITVSKRYDVSKVFHKILQVPNVIVTFRTIGDIHIIAALPFKNIDKLLKSYREITAIPGVTEIGIVISQPFPSWPLNIYSKLIPKQCEQV